jgi:hypothetical protein
MLKKRSVTVQCAPRTASPSESGPVSSSCSRRTALGVRCHGYPGPVTENGTRKPLSSRDLRSVLKAHQNGAPPHYHRASSLQSLLRRLGVFYGPPRYLLTDNGTQFNAKFFLAVCRELGIAKILPLPITRRLTDKLRDSIALSSTLFEDTSNDDRETGTSTRQPLPSGTTAGYIRPSTWRHSS